jgi:hypothetical protein
MESEMRNRLLWIELYKKYVNSGTAIVIDQYDISKERILVQNYHLDLQLRKLKRPL